MSELLERDEELERISALLDGARGGDGAALALEGPPGIGKTRLLDAAAARAEGLTVARAAGSELEREFGYGVARQLLEPLLDGPLDGAARLAAPALGVPGEPAAERYGVIHGLYWLTANLASERPLLLLVDDLQWVDPPSQRFLAYLARRLDGLPAGLMAAVRPPIPGEDRALVDAVASAVSAPRRSASAPSPRSPSPKAARSAPRNATRRPAGTRSGCTQCSTTGALEPVARDVLRRIDTLGPDAVALTHAAAVLGGHASLDAAAALAGWSGRGRARGQLRWPRRTCSPRRRAALPPSRRARGGRRRARAGRAGGRPRPRGAAARRARGAAVEIAAHLRLAPAGRRSVGGRAAARGGPRGPRAGRPGAPPRCSSARWPSLRPAAGHVLRELASAELAAGQPGGIERMHDAFAALDDPRERAAAALELSSTLHVRMQPRVAIDLLSRARAGLEDRELDLTLEALLAAHARMDLATAGDTLERFQRRVAGLAGDTQAERFAIAAAAALAPSESAAEHARGAELLERVVASGRHPPGMSESGIVSSLIRATRLHVAEEAIARRLEQARAAGQLSRVGILLLMRGWCASSAARWRPPRLTSDRRWSWGPSSSCRWRRSPRCSRSRWPSAGGSTRRRRCCASTTWRASCPSTRS